MSGFDPQKLTDDFFGNRYDLDRIKSKGRLSLRNFKISCEPIEDPSDLSGDEDPDERRKFDGTLSVDGVPRIIRGDGNGPLSALLDGLRTHLDIDLSIRKYEARCIGEGRNSKTLSHVEVVTAGDRTSTESWWGVGVDYDIAGSGLRALLSAANSAIGDRALPELKLSLGFNARSSVEDIANLIVNSLGLELPRRFLASFFEVVQKKAQDSGGEISYEALTELFRNTYGYDIREGGPKPKLSMNSFKMDHLGSRRQLNVEVVFHGEVGMIRGEGNGPLSALLSALHSHVEGTLTIREYSEHSVGEGTEVIGASYVELTYEVVGSKKNAWGVATDADITVSGIKAVLCAANRLDIVIRAS